MATVNRRAGAMAARVAEFTSPPPLWPAAKAARSVHSPQEKYFYRRR
ncbi:hypothetical protein SODG_003428 [Sodalis praecaptivus]